MSGLLRAVAMETIATIASAIGQARALILLYHSVSDVRSGLAVPTRVFGQQMRYLADHFELLTVSELLARLTPSAEHAHPLAALTFDDGYADNFDHVLPILAAHHARATFYPITGLLGLHQSDPAHPATPQRARSAVAENAGWSTDRHGQAVPMLSWEQLLQMVGQGHEIGAHTVHHPKLHQLPVEEVRREVFQCKSDLEARLKVPVASFAYPRGHYTPVVKELVRAAGFTSAVTIHEGTLGPAFDPFELPRIPVQPDTSLAAFKARTTVAINWYSRLQRRRQ
jgi:peptidoglycan/xylan/chitin deacetylase (PgdA/CDA1 family)